MKGIINNTWPYVITSSGSVVEIIREDEKIFWVKLVNPTEKNNQKYIGDHFEILKKHIDLVYDYLPFFEAL